MGMGDCKPCFVLSVQSHVVHGHVGNRSATFPLQLLGCEVDVVNSVQLATHTGYDVIKGQKLNGDELRELTLGLEANGIMADVFGDGKGGYTHLLTGYIGSDTFLSAVLELLDSMQRGNPDCKYICDPVLGDDGKLYVPESLIDIYRTVVLPRAHLLTPNQFEVEKLLGRDTGSLSTLEQVCEAADDLHQMGPPVVCITTVDACSSEDHVAMLLSQKDKQPKWLLMLPRINGGPFTGTGDLTAAMLLAWSEQHRDELPTALEKAGAVLQGVLRMTVDSCFSRRPRESASKRRVPPELQLVHSKRYIEDPQVSWRCRAVWPPHAPALCGVLFAGGRTCASCLVDSRGVRPATKALLDGLRERSLRASLLVSRQSDCVAELEELLPLFSFDPVITPEFLEQSDHKESFYLDCVQNVCSAWNSEPAAVLVVADNEYALSCCSKAGARTCAVLDGEEDRSAILVADVVVSDPQLILSRLFPRELSL